MSRRISFLTIAFLVACSSKPKTDEKVESRAGNSAGETNVKSAEPGGTVKVGEVAKPAEGPTITGTVSDGGKQPELTGGATDEVKATKEAIPEDPKEALKAIQKPKVSDDDATKTLEALKTNPSVKPRQVAEAAYKRGLALQKYPERAKKFFEWAAETDKRYPDPVFALAKQAVTIGDLETAKTYLVETKNRKGTKLLNQIDFDPTWEVLKDDPEVRKLLPAS